MKYKVLKLAYKNTHSHIKILKEVGLIETIKKENSQGKKVYVKLLANSKNNKR